MPADKKNMKGQGKRKGRREEVKMEQGKEKEERRRKSLCKPMPVVLFALILIVVMIPLSQAEQQIYEVWNRTWNADVTDIAYGITVDSHGYIYVTGYTCPSVPKGYGEGLLQKYAPDGNLIDHITFDPSICGDGCVGYDVAVADTGHIYVIGKVREEGSPENFDVILLKYDQDGNLVWNRRWGEENKDDVGKSIAIDSNGYIYVTGYTASYGAGGEMQCC